MQTKASAALLLVAATLLACAGCGHQETGAAPGAAPSSSPAPGAAPNSSSAPGAAPNSSSAQANQAAANALNDPKTPPGVKDYIKQHQGQAAPGAPASGQATPTGGQ